MGRILRSGMDEQPSGHGSTRTLVATAFAVWALLLQSLLPVAGAFASDTGNTFLVELCTTAGVQTVALDAGEGSPEQPLQSKTGFDCDVCFGCGCARGALHGMALASVPADAWTLVSWHPTSLIDNRSDAASAFHSRAPPVA